MRTNKVKQLVINAMLAAICFVLAYFSLTFVNIKFTFESIPVHLGALFFGPAAGMAIGGIGTFLYQRCHCDHRLVDRPLYIVRWVRGFCCQVEKFFSDSYSSNRIDGNRRAHHYIDEYRRPLY